MKKLPVVFATICLNESRYLGANIRQHIDFCDRWIIVEGADRNYPKERVTSDGLSTDGTSQLLDGLASVYPQIAAIHHGFANNKSELRNRYADLVTQDCILIVFDADEFLTHRDLEWLIKKLRNLKAPDGGCVRLPHIHFWKSDQQIITGGYYNIAHHRTYRWIAGSRYGENHNHPVHPRFDVPLSNLLNVVIDRHLVQEPNGNYHHPDPCWLHYGFVKDPDDIKDKNAYYVNRGEAVTRPGTTRDRAAWFQGDVEPENCKILPWGGPWPEELMPAGGLCAPDNGKE